MGLTAKIHEDWHTPIPEFRKLSLCPVRGREVQAWLDKHPEVTNWVALDDDRNFSADQKSNHVRTDPNKGLTIFDAHLANEILRRTDKIILV